MLMHSVKASQVKYGGVCVALCSYANNAQWFIKKLIGNLAAAQNRPIKPKLKIVNEGIMASKILKTIISRFISGKVVRVLSGHPQDFF